MVSYPALFEAAEEGGFVITFPDFGYGVTQAETEAEAAVVASDLLACLISDRIAAGIAAGNTGAFSPGARGRQLDAAFRAPGKELAIDVRNAA